MTHRLFRTCLTAAVAVTAAFALSPASPAAAAAPQCDGSGVLVKGTYSSWIPAYHASNFNCYLLRGSNNAGVGWLQRSLNAAWDGTPGYNHLVVDNDFGGNTQQALRFAQNQYGIRVDGGYGAQTRDKICWVTFNHPEEGQRCLWFNS